MLLDEVLQRVAKLHGEQGELSAQGLSVTSSMLTQVERIVSSAAAIEAKRNDQRISATHVLTLLVALRDDLKRTLYSSFGEHAAAVVDGVFTRARWTGGLSEEAVRDALLEPASFDFRLRVVEREGDVLRETETAKDLTQLKMPARDSAPDDGSLDDVASITANGGLDETLPA